MTTLQINTNSCKIFAIFRVKTGLESGAVYYFVIVTISICTSFTIIPQYYY